MEHSKVSAMMAGWYKMFGGKLEVRAENMNEGVAEMLRVVADRMADQVASGDRSQETEEKEEAQEKACSEVSLTVLPLSHQEQTSSLELVQHCDSNGQGYSKQDAQ